jgi:hypothetical protein
MTEPTSEPPPLETPAEPVADSAGARSSRPTSRLFAVVLLLCVFALGGVTGIGITRAYMLRELRSAMGGPPSESRAHFRLEAMRRRLDLDDSQVEQLEVVLRESEAERDRLMEPCRAGLDDLRERTDARVLAVLRPDQRARFEELGDRKGKFRHTGAPHGPGR